MTGKGLRGSGRQVDLQLWLGLWQWAARRVGKQVVHERCFGQQHLRGIERLETHAGHHAVGQGRGGLGEAACHHMGIGAVQRRAGAPPRVRHAQHPAEQLLHVLARPHVLQRAQNVGERAVPALLQRLDGDDEAHRTGTVEQVDAVQPTLLAGGDDDLVRRDVLLLYQVLAQHVGRCSTVAVVRLEQNQRAQIAAALPFLMGGLGFELLAAQHRVAHRVFPGRVLGQHDRQLDHVLGFQFARGHAVQHVGLLRHRRGGQLEDGAGRNPRKRGKGGVGLGVVGLVDHDDRPRQRQQIGQRMLDPPEVGGAQKGLARFVEIGLRHPFEHPRVGSGDLRFEVLEMRVELFAESVDVAALRLLDAKALHRRDQHDGAAAEVLRRQRGRGVELEHRQRLPISRLECRAVRVPGGLQRAQGLVTDGGRRHQPQRHRKVGGTPFAGHQRNRVCRQQRLAAAGGDAQAHAGHLAERVAAVGQRLHRGRPVLGSHFGRPGVVQRSIGACSGQEAAQAVEGLRLVGLEGEGGHVQV